MTARAEFDLVEEAFDQRLCDVGMDALSAAAQQRGVGCVLHERVFKCVLRVRRRAARMDEVGGHELTKSVLQRLLLNR